MRLSHVAVVVVLATVVLTDAKFQEWNKNDHRGFQDPSGTPGYKAPPAPAPRKKQGAAAEAMKRVKNLHKEL